MLTTLQKSKIKERFQELREKLIKLQNAKNDFEKSELGKNRDWKKIAEMIANPELDKTERMKPLQYPDCFVCEAMEKKCFIWDKNPENKDCPELLFKGFCFVDPENDFNNPSKCGLYKRQIMHKRCLMRLAIQINKNKPDAEGVKDITRYCQHCCPKYQECIKQKTLYDQYLFCENVLEKALLETINDVDEIIKKCN